MAAMTIRLPRLRHLRHGLADVDNTRRRRLQRWLASVVTNLTGTASTRIFTATNATNRLTDASHGLTTGDGPFLVVNSGGALPAGLSNTTLYWARVIDANTLTLHGSKHGAQTDTNIAEFSDDGTGTQVMIVGSNAQALVEQLRQGQTATNLNAEDDVDDLI